MILETKTRKKERKKGDQGSSSTLNLSSFYLESEQWFQKKQNWGRRWYVLRLQLWKKKKDTQVKCFFYFFEKDIK